MQTTAHRSVLFGAIVLCCFLSQQAQAHFLWIHSNLDKGRLVLKAEFGEPLESSAEYIKVAARSDFFLFDAKGARKTVALTMSEDGKTCSVVLEDSAVSSVHGTLVYGLFGRSGPQSLLTYHAKRMVSAPADWKILDSDPSAIIPVELKPKMDGNDLILTAYADGKVLADAEVKGYGANKYTKSQKSDAKGETRWKDLPAGELAFYFGRTIDEKGTHEKNPYEKKKDYATLSLVVKDGKEEKVTATAAPGQLLPLPEQISSFGAATTDGFVYIYGGHIGTAHSHSNKNLTGAFRRASLTNGGKWETLPSGRAVQGTALVAEGGKLYRIGGMEARNAPEAADDMHSVTDVMAYDPKTNDWSALESLPKARSSHDAIAMDGKLYVIGGWNLQSPAKEEWHDTALVLDLKTPGAKWQELPKPPFQRRALAITAANGKIYVIAGFLPDAKVASNVDIFDVAANKWVVGPEIPKENRNGFGISAVTVGGRVVVNGFDGKVYRLSTDGSKWETAGKASIARFFHRLAAKDNKEILLLAGASMEGHVDDVEAIVLQ